MWAGHRAVDAVIVTHGTFTAEETAYFLHLVVRTSKPVLMTCSQRKHGMIGNDGDRNLLDAVLANRGGGGRVPVSGDYGFVRGDTMSAQKARVLLSLALTQTQNVSELQRMFDE